MNRAKPIWLFFPILFHSLSCYSQQGYKVTYTQEPVVFPKIFGAEVRTPVPPKQRLVFSDSLSFAYSLSGTNPVTNKNVYGAKLIHHGTFYNTNSGFIYRMSNGPPGKKDQYLIWDTIGAENWNFVGESKKILGYNCIAALYVNSKNDSTLVWYTTEIPRPFGPFSYVGFPGLVMEVSDQRNRLQIKATKIDKDEVIVLMPQKIKLISMAEAIELRIAKPTR